MEPLEQRQMLDRGLVISEFMADNQGTLPDGDGNYEDWIEIYNPADVAVNLDGWFLTDDMSDLSQWRLPDVSIASGEFFVVFASGQVVDDYVDAGGHLHTNFRLDPDGESLALVKPDATTVAHAYADYPQQFPDVSFGVTNFGPQQQTLVAPNDPITFHVPTPGEDPLAWTPLGFDDASWNDTVTADAAGLVITEISTGTTKFVEVQNASDREFTKTGWSVLLNDSSGGINDVNDVNDVAWSLPSSIAAGSVLCRTDDQWGAPIDWSMEGPGWAMIVDDGGSVVDFLPWGYTEGQIDSMGITIGTQWAGNGVDRSGGLLGPEEDVFGLGSTWNYLHPLDGVNPHGPDPDFNTTWMTPAVYDGPAFAGSGPGILGYGTINRPPGIQTNIGEPVSGNRYTAYFRREFTLTSEIRNAKIEILSDDGAAVYIDGAGPYRNNFSAVDTYTALANGVGSEDNTATLSIADLSAGTHTVAVSVHQVSSTNSSDIGFDLRLFGQPVTGPAMGIVRVGYKDNDTAADFVLTNTPTSGAQNPDIDMPFGTVTPANLGVGFSNDQAAFDALIGSDVGPLMQGENASLWARVEFDGSNLVLDETLTLRMKYDDGFVAYLNGTEVARRNADNPLAWNTVASAQRDNNDAVVFEDIDVSASLGLLVPGTNVLAIHGQNLSAGDADLLVVPELLINGTSFDAQPKWFTSSSPRSENGTGGEYPGVVINEIHYDPDVRTELVEFIELYNGSADPIDLSGWYFDEGIDWVFPAATSIGGYQYLVVTQDTADFYTKFGFTPPGPWTGRLDSDGERVTLRNDLGERMDRVEYRRGFPWPTIGDWPGRSIELVNPSLDNDLGGSWRPSLSGPTPGAQNSNYAADANAAPHMRQVDHSPKQPLSGEDVTLTVKVTDVHGVQDVTLHYQLVDPGSYIEYDDPAYATTWTDVAMVDNGTNGDAVAGDDVYTVVLPGTLQMHRRLVRYRITATDDSPANLSRTGPYDDDPAGNFAYFVYDGVPSWTGSARPGVAPEVEYSSEVLTQVPVYHLITTREDHEDSQHIPDSTIGGYGGSEYLWQGTLVYDGEVYDHIRYRARGGVWRYSMGKNMWKFDFNRGHSFQAKDDFGNEYDIAWDKLNFSACIQQGDYQHRGEQGMFEAAGFKLFNLAGVEAPNTNWVHFRIVESADEEGPDQFSGDFQGLYMAIEQMDGRFLDEHELPDGNLYKIEGHNAESNNQGPTAVSDRSDFYTFKNGYYYDPNPTEQWWRDNVELEKYYSYRAIVEGIHHGDIAYGKNYFFYLDPETNLWSMLPWDLDLTWANNMYGDGEDPFRKEGAILSNSALDLEYKNRLREINDLLYNTEQVYAMLDELAAVIDDPLGGPSIVDADRAMWDYNPIMVSSYVHSSKAGYGRFYQQATTKDFPGMVQLMKNYVTGYRSFATNTADPYLPNTPTISYVGQAGYPGNQLIFESSAFSDGTGSFAAMEWRLAEVTDPAAPAYDPLQPLLFEITGTWKSGELATFDDQITLPPAVAAQGHAYRARVRMKDSTGRWSHWSAPVQFIAGAPVGSELTESLRITEMMYNPSDLPPGGAYDDDEFEFVELRNVGGQTLDISGVSFTDGITFSFAGSEVTSLDPGEFVVVAKNLTAFATRYDTTGMNLVGGYPDYLADSSERIALSDATDGLIQAFTYDDAWYPTTDGGGFSLSVVDEQAAVDQWNNSNHWQPSLPVHGTPGAANVGIPTGAVIINEVLAHSDGGDGDWIELFNTTDTAISLGGWFLSDDGANLAKYEIAGGKEIPAYDYIVFTELADFGASFALSEHGDHVYLTSGSSGLPGGYREHVDFGASPNGATFGLFTDSVGNTDFTLLSAPTSGEANASPYVGNLVINEVMYHPSDPTPEEIAAGFTNDADFEFVELCNRSGGSVDLTKYYLANGVSFSFGWYDTDDSGTAVWTFDAGGTAAWTASLPQADTYEVLIWVDDDDGLGGTVDLDSAAQYEIHHTGDPSVVGIDQNAAPGNWFSLGSFSFDAGDAVVNLTRGTTNPDERTIADRIKFVSATDEVFADDDDPNFQTTGSALTTLGPGQYVVLVNDFGAFDKRYDAVDNGILVAGEFTGNLANGGEALRLYRSAAPAEPVGVYIRVDKLEYGDVAPWPEAPDGAGSSLSRVVTADYGNDVANWEPSTFGGTPGAANGLLDSTPPSVPAGLDATVVSPNRIDLDWDASIDPESGVNHYVIYRNGIPLDTAPGVFYSDTDVSPLRLYQYEVSAVNGDGYESATSPMLSVTVPGVESIFAPDETTVQLVFSEPVTAASAEVAGNYALTGEAITDAVLDPDGVTVTLTTSELLENTGYTLAVNNVQTVSGNTVPPGLEKSFTFRPEGLGVVLREYWTGVGGSQVGDLTADPDYPDNPDGHNYPALLETPTDWADAYGTRIRGYVVPPLTGDYVFWIAGDDTAQLFLSTDEDPANKVLIALVPSPTNPRQWDADPVQQSGEVYLENGRRYYIEALHKEDTTGDHLAVAWQLPDFSFEGPIPGERLSPWLTGDDQDFGDVPEDQTAYPTTLSRNGARHIIAGPWLGPPADAPDAEPDGQPSADASGDNGNGADDENGVTFTTLLTAGRSDAGVQIDLSGSPVDARLSAWIDFNHDGDWLDSGEQIFTDVLVGAGSTPVLNFSVPYSAVAGPSFARFRVNSQGGLSPAGPAADGEVEDHAVEIYSRVEDRHVFYNNSAFDDNNPGADTNDDDAVAPDKEALLPGGLATFDNYTSYARGLNGVMVDVAGLAVGHPVSQADFLFAVGNSDDPNGWSVAPAPTTITLRDGAGTNGSDRITIIWDDYAIRQQWLQVTVLDTGLGLSGGDVFCLGNAVAEAGNSTTDAQVTTTDLLLARNNPRNYLNAATIDFRYDYDRDERVNSTDVLLARNNQTNFLTRLRLLDLTGGMAAAGQAAARDAALEELAVEEAALLYDVEQLGSNRRESNKGPTAEQAVDRLLATLDW